MTQLFINNQEVATITDQVANKTYSFPFSINTMNWNYQLNTQSFSTIGGRVTQLLSTNITSLVVEGDAGNRANLLQLWEDYKSIQDGQTQRKIPALFNVPSRPELGFSIWLKNFQMGFGVTTVSYEYTLYMEVHTDVGLLATNAATADALNRIVNNNGGEIGFSSQFTGLDTSLVNLQFKDIENALSTGYIFGTNSTTPR